MWTKYLLKRAVFLALTLVLSIYLAVVIANAGGLIDQIIRSQIMYDLRTNLARTPGWSQLTAEEQTEF